MVVVVFLSMLLLLYSASTLCGGNVAGEAPDSMWRGSNSRDTQTTAARTSSYNTVKNGTPGKLINGTERQK
jgi:hypothetical protein